MTTTTLSSSSGSIPSEVGYYGDTHFDNKSSSGLGVLSGSWFETVRHAAQCVAEVEIGLQDETEREYFACYWHWYNRLNEGA